VWQTLVLELLGTWTDQLEALQLRHASCPLNPISILYFEHPK
jgi:hypothetical protein